MARIPLITAAAIGAVGLIVGIYFLVFTGGSKLAVTPGAGSSLPAAGNQTPVTGSGSQTVTTATTTSAATAVSARFVEISKGPVVSGTAVVDIPAPNASSSPDVSVKYIERQSGNVYAYSMTGHTITRTSNRTLPGIERAIWNPSGTTALVQYLSGNDFSTVNTYALFADGSGGFFLPQNLADIAVSSSSILELASGVNGTSGSVARSDGSHASEVFTTALSSVRASFAGKDQYLVFTKPSASLAGYAFSVNSAGRFTRVAGPYNGLTALASPSGKWALISYADGDSIVMQLVNTTTGESIPLPISTLTDKCVWAADDSAAYCGVPTNLPSAYAYPDDWYQGAVHFSDSIWKIDVSGRFAQFILDFSKDAKSDLDAEALSIDPQEKALTFVNKNDGSLWLYQL